MSRKGGYQIVDFKGKELAPDSITVIPGIYELIEGNYNKPILCSGIVFNGVEYDDTFSEAKVSDDGDIHIEMYGRDVVINDDDQIYSGKVQYPFATVETYGIVKMAEKVAFSGTESTVEELATKLKTLASKLMDAGIMSRS